jgi:ADP-ribosylglycohydrolase
MIGAIAGDINGSVHEGAGTKTKAFPLFDEHCRFTDDTVLTIAVAAQLLHGGEYVDVFHEYFHAYPHAGYGESFVRSAGYRRREPYNSWGNGAAMRVSPVGFACGSLEEVLARARQSAEVTHNHWEGIRGRSVG